MRAIDLADRLNASGENLLQSFSLELSSLTWASEQVAESSFEFESFRYVCKCHG